MIEAPTVVDGVQHDDRAVRLSVRDLSVSYRTTSGAVLTAVDEVSFELGPQEVLGIVGESGSGKSSVLRAIMRLQPPGGSASGEVLFDGEDLLSLSASEMRRRRGAGIAAVFQDPHSCLNPVLPIGWQIAEACGAGGGLGRAEIGTRTRELLELVGVPDAGRRMSAYPHELSGGLKQRIAIAIAIARSPRLLLADEPTTALDVTIQDQILSLLGDLRDRLSMSMILVTHDLGVVAETCSRVAVMYAGRIVEIGPVQAVLSSPSHPYTDALLASIPQLGTAHERLNAIPGAPPELGKFGDGCRFAPRCRFALDACRTELPALVPESPERSNACLRSGGWRQTA